jgi:6-phosphogluconolactonase
VSPSGKYLYVTNANTASLSAYSVNSGALQPIPGSPFPVGNGPLAVAVDPSEHFVYVTNAADSTFSILAIDSTTGVLANILGSPFSVMLANNTGAATGSISMAVHPTGTFLYIANQTAGNVSIYSIASTSVPTEITGSPIATGKGTNFVVMDPSGKYLFVGDQNNRNISVFSIDSSTGALTLTSSVSTGVGATSMAVSK